MRSCLVAATPTWIWARRVRCTQLRWLFRSISPSAQRKSRLRRSRARANSSSFDISSCTAQIIDFAGNDRPWITSDGARVYISCHDSKNSSLIRVQRSDDEGFTWTRVGDAITGAGPTTGSATFNNTAGPVVADPVSHNVYSIFASGEVGILKAKTTDFNNIFVSRSTDAGKHWTPVLVFAGPLLSTNANVFPAVAVDPANGNVYATWSNAKIGRAHV